MKSRGIWLSGALLVLSGCSWLDIGSGWGGREDYRSQSPDRTESGQSDTPLVGDLAVPFGTHPIRVEAVGLLTGLQGTGSDPVPGPKRAVVVSEIQRHGVENPNQLLRDPSTAMVLVQGVLRPGIQKGDHFDVEVRIPSRSETTSLRGGHLLENRLRQMAVLNNRFHEGHVLALCEGPVMVDPGAQGKADHVALGRGRILGGGVTLKSRSLGLVLKPDHQSVVNSARIATALNKRFHTFDKGVKVGAANAQTDKYIELTVHPRYKDNITRYMQLVRAVALRESSTQRMQRIGRLQDRLLDPITSAKAALELEAIGTDGVETLKLAVRSTSAEVRFYAAEALAYLEQREAAEPLGQAARREPAFRVFALTALSALNDFAAYEQLRDLLAIPSAETRYGAFRALWAMNPEDPLVLGEQLNGQFSYHVLDTGGPPMIHATRNLRPEIVLFGKDQNFREPLAVNAGNQVMITGTGSGEISVSKYSVDQPDQKRMVSTRVDEVIRAIVELGGTYPDVVQALQEAKAAGSLAGRFEVDALPEAGRKYDRLAGDDAGPGISDRSRRGMSKALPDLFSRKGESNTRHRTDSRPEVAETTQDRGDSEDKPHPLGSFFARMTGRDSD